MGIKLYAAGILAIVGGILMVASGYASRGLLLTVLPYLQSELSNYLTGSTDQAANLVITTLEVIIGLGGVTVAAGGLVILARHTSIGRLMIYLGGAAGFLGLIVSFGYTVYKLGGLDPTLTYAPYWVGLVMAIVARRLAKN